MRPRAAALIVAGLLLFSSTALAHRLDEYLQATVLSLSANHVEASMRLIPGISVSSTVITAIDTNGDGAFSEEEKRLYALQVLHDLSIESDGMMVLPELISWRVPQPAQLRDGIGEILIEYSFNLPAGGQDRSLVLTNHHLSGASVYLINVLIPQAPGIHILAQKRNAQQSSYELDYQQRAIAAPQASWKDFGARLSGAQFSSFFHLGMHHIAEGTDHLLFLLTLLLPAPLLALGSRWGPPASVRQSLFRILGVVTAFTVGHSITLFLAALGAVHVPGRPVEVLIALSILISAMHALRPIVPGKEALIAGCFGLIHGLAFAATLDRLGLGLWDRVSGILAFNLGIEAMQMIVVAAVLPSLLLLSRTPAYAILRISGAVLAAVASTGWMFERTFDVYFYVDRSMNLLAHHKILITIFLLLAALACRLLQPRQSRQASSNDPVHPEITCS